MTTTIRPLAALSAMALACAMSAGTAHAQSAANCPLLPNGSGLTWKALDAPTLTFCKAIRDSDGREMFAVTLSAKSPFKPSRAQGAERGTIDGREVRWYRSENAFNPKSESRETLVELDGEHVMHISLHAVDATELPALLQQAESIRMPSVRLTSN